MTIRSFAAGLALGAAFVAAPAYAQSTEALQIAGSSTVLPYAQIVASPFAVTPPPRICAPHPGIALQAFHTSTQSIL